MRCADHQYAENSKAGIHCGYSSRISLPKAIALEKFTTHRRFAVTISIMISKSAQGKALQQQRADRPAYYSSLKLYEKTILHFIYDLGRGGCRNHARKNFESRN